MKIGRLHVLTDAEIQTRFDHVEIAERAIRGGADAIQYRRKTGSTRETIREARAIRSLCRRAGIPLIVNDRVDVALAADADGVHLGRDDFPIEKAREILGPHRILGGSAGTVDEARAGQREGADYLGVGPVYATRTKPDAGPAAGIDLVAQVATELTIPILGIGGIDAGNLAPVLEAGAFGVAIVSAICCDPDPEEATRRVQAAIAAALAASAGRHGPTEGR